MPLTILHNATSPHAFASFLAAASTLRWRARVGLHDVLAQILVALVLFMAVYWLVGNVISNLERQNIASGFGFFNERAGFGINQTLIDYDEDNNYGRVLAVGRSRLRVDLHVRGKHAPWGSSQCA